MYENIHAAILASFVADAFSLGPHWIYDTERIDSLFGRVSQVTAPPEGSFHKGKKRGDFTHYGDQTLLLLETIAGDRAFSIGAFADAWQAMMAGYAGYFDHATKETLENRKEGLAPESAGSGSTDLGGASRIAPLLAIFGDDEAALVAAARAQTAMTHNVADVIDAAEFFARLTVRVLSGTDPASGIETLLPEGFDREPFAPWIRRGLASRTESTRSVVSRFGQMCGVNGAFPSVIHIIARYPGDLKTALIENVLAGGDSAARGLIIGMVLAARQGIPAIPESWLAAMRAREHILDLLKRFT